MPPTSTVAALPTWSVAPFGLYLFAIAATPLAFGHFWEKNLNKFFVAIAASVPVVALLVAHPLGAHWLLDSAGEYVAFMALLTSLFVISGGVYLSGTLAGTPLVNTGFLAIGALVASLIGTTGASMLLIRPLLRANETRERKVHIVVFFIFIVSNGAGMLTPLGDPPLFLGFLRGVPFFWTLRLAGPWALVNGLLLLVFNVVDQVVLNKEELARPGSQLEELQAHRVPLSLEGRLNLLWLFGVVAVIYVMGAHGEAISTNHGVRLVVQVVGMATFGALSMLTTPRDVRAANRFTWAPIVEVAVVFVGIFITMVPALRFLESKGAALGLREPWQFFWAAGLLSSFLDNAPTYLTFTTLSVGVLNQGGGAFSSTNLAALAADPAGATLLTAISCGAVFMGANTYIGNGPNFMVKAIAEETGVKMPGFFRYMAWSGAILVPLFVVATFVFFR